MSDRTLVLFQEFLSRCAKAAISREDMWAQIVGMTDASILAEVGVFKGEFAVAMLSSCPRISKYYMIDPWKHLPDWNKPANVDDATFDNYYREAMKATSPFKEKRVVSRKTTKEAANDIPDASVDFAYIDGDHTLRGITIDLLTMLPKIRNGGIIGGDDFSASIWQHQSAYEPTMVFPYAIHFAEAVGAKLYALPFNQFLIHKAEGEFQFIDLVGIYGNTELSVQVRPHRHHRWSRAFSRS